MAKGKSSIKLRAKEKNGVTTVKALMSHPMETGQRKNKKTGENIPEHFIQEVVGEYNGKVVITTSWSGGVSKDPYLSFSFKGGANGEMVKVSWTDNKGGSDSNEVKIKGKK
ncbi:thiosulfate oxidation carrier complex protein SoxZ [Solemya velum gill symbiont]|uniref:thiosulfate oxidation carrier complex protein SoxZ n=1 Tax=Solemya velum gill symbiont TaxID=2340 RepID=UPI0009984476|nr:thiosulfate oxidation carrier complex protein SoxZ [Solemya velum gill symbiont]OOY53700.1 thiosulfate oxidation carrier complex protein SoxZ [Solemya velum gill symbiont]OOY57492.1 thiosulfate oxidation carrier complex protein SoxZ [Solemya velum gill symbiont]OOY58516.1 thiosulfate oxidation carrier complex protein SoxZ [Solemya velum gill symbiont]OOY61160.1 thiosulfate oxidation carrier complex protein SoxZ [Solemya velum gill symbiont]OOY62688.1 thiosulfate oxidation carrier complex pr